MERFFAEATAVTPRVEFDKNTGVFTIQGKSLPEDVKSFYLPLAQWLDEYIQHPNPSTDLVLDFDYFNTATSKMLLILLNKFKELYRNGHEVQVTWRYPQSDLELEEAGEELSDILKIPFNIAARPVG